MKTAKQYDPTTSASWAETERILTGMLEFEVVAKWLEGLIDDVRERPLVYRRRPGLMADLVEDLQFAVGEIRELEKQTWEMVEDWLTLRQMMGE